MPSIGDLIGIPNLSSIHIQKSSSWQVLPASQARIVFGAQNKPGSTYYIDINSWWFCLKSGWWFGTFFIFPYIGNNNPNWLIFFRGVETTNQKRVLHVGAPYDSKVSLKHLPYVLSTGPCFSPPTKFFGWQLERGLLCSPRKHVTNEGRRIWRNINLPHSQGIQAQGDRQLWDLEELEFQEVNSADLAFKSLPHLGPSCSSN